MAVNLAEGQRLSLGKSGGGQLTRVFRGLGWDVSVNGFHGIGATTSGWTVQDLAPAVTPHR